MLQDYGLSGCSDLPFILGMTRLIHPIMSSPSFPVIVPYSWDCRVGEAQL